MTYLLSHENEEQEELMEQSLRTQLLLHRPDIHEHLAKEEAAQEFKERQARPESEEDLQELLEDLKSFNLFEN